MRTHIYVIFFYLHIKQKTLGQTPPEGILGRRFKSSELKRMKFPPYNIIVSMKSSIQPKVMTCILKQNTTTLDPSNERELFWHSKSDTFP